MNLKLYLLYLLLWVPVLLYSKNAAAQAERTPYTGTNRIMAALEGPVGRYEFVSEHMLVRYNKESQQLECVLPVASLLPANDTVPPNMAYEVLFGAKYPQMYLSMPAPVQEINAGTLGPETLRRTTSISLQGVTNQTVVPVNFTSENNSLYFSTSFDLMLDNFQASMPRAYLPLLTGRVLIIIDRARMVDFGVR